MLKDSIFRNPLYRIMELEEFVKRFTEQFEDADDFSADTEFKELDEWSSLSAIHIIAFIDTEYDVEVSGAEIRRANTIQDLFDIVDSKKR